MANGIERLLKRSDVDDAEVELARVRSLQRLARISDPSAGWPDELETDEVGADGSVEDKDPVEGSADGIDVIAWTTVDDEEAARVIDAHDDMNNGVTEAAQSDSTESTELGMARQRVFVIGSYGTQPASNGRAPDEVSIVPATTGALEEPAQVALFPAGSTDTVPVDDAGPVDDADMNDEAFATPPSDSAEAVSEAAAVVGEAATVVEVYCPYCATVQDPAPTATKRCARCHNRIIVEHVGARTVYLTEASLPFFEAEQARLAEVAAQAVVRDYWLELAASHGATADKVKRITRDEASEAKVAAARALYIAAVDEAFESAVRRSDWQDAARLRLDQSAVLFKLARDAARPSDVDEAVVADPS